MHDEIITGQLQYFQILSLIMSSVTQSSRSQGSAPTCRRIYLTDEKKLMLVPLCVENQADFQERKKGQFWAMISDLLHQEAGIFLKDPAGMFEEVYMYLILVNNEKNK